MTKDERSHLVAVVKVPEEEDQHDPEGSEPWYLFNDFTVRNISEDEALSFPANWKVRVEPKLDRYS